MHSITSLFDVPATQKVAASSVLALMSHGSPRDAYPPGRLVSLVNSRYVPKVNGGQVKVVNTIGKDGPAFLPQVFSGRPKLRQHLAKTPIKKPKKAKRGPLLR